MSKGQPALLKAIEDEKLSGVASTNQLVGEEKDDKKDESRMTAAELFAQV